MLDDDDNGNGKSHAAARKVGGGGHGSHSSIRRHSAGAIADARLRSLWRRPQHDATRRDSASSTRRSNVDRFFLLTLVDRQDSTAWIGSHKMSTRLDTRCSSRHQSRQSTNDHSRHPLNNGGSASNWPSHRCQSATRSPARVRARQSGVVDWQPRACRHSSRRRRQQHATRRPRCATRVE